MNQLRLKATLLLGILSAGALVTWWVVEQTDHEMRAGILQNTQLLAQSISIERLKALTGSEADLSSPVYLRLKEQLATICSANPQYHRIYLLRQKADETIFFNMDCEAAGSKNDSPPGQIYADPPEACIQVFGTRSATTQGPFNTGQDKSMSVLIPIFDPNTVMVGLATPEDAHAMVLQAVDYYRKNGRERLLEEVNNPKGEFHKGDLYAFVYDRNMTWLAHPVEPKLVGKNWIDKKDWSKGKYFRREIQEVTRSKGSGWVEFEYKNPINGQHDHKTTFVQGVDDLIICSGAYKGNGEILAVLDIDVDVRDWNKMLVRAALPTLLSTLALVAIVLLGSILLARRSRLSRAHSRWMWHLEPLIAAAAGLVLTLYAVWTTRLRETHERHGAFLQLAESWSGVFAETLYNLRDIGLESLPHFFENDNTVTSEEFKRFTNYLTKNTIIQAWEWIPVVPASDKSRFEEAARAAGLAGFEIWQKNAQGQREPASGRAFYYPVFYAAPTAGNELALGYDLGSEPLRSRALESAMRTRLPTATEPVTLVQETSKQRGMLICRPVFDQNDPGRLRGFILAVLRMGSVLRNAAPDDSLLMELSLLRKGAAAEPLALSWSGDMPGPSTLSMTRTVLAFGDVFTVTVHAGPEFLRLHPLRECWLAGIFGAVGTACITVVISILIRRRQQLERMVFKRTAELRESEKKYRSIIEQSPLGIFQTTLEGRPISVNSALVAIFGYDSQEEMLTAIDNQRFFRTNPSPQSLHCEVIYRRKDGTPFPANLHMRAVHGTKGKVKLLEGFVEDITERKRGEETSNRLAAIVNSSEDAIIGKDLNGIITSWNRGAEKIFDYTATEMEGTSILRLIPADRHQEEHDILEEIRSGGSVDHFETLRLAKDGRLLDVSLTVSPIKDASGGIIGVSKVARDITHRKQAEKYREMGREILPILYGPGDLQDSVRRVLAILKEGTGFDAVGIRLHAGEDFPYFVQEGFPKDFLLTENTLVERAADGGVCRDKDGKPCLECTCGLVISGKTVPANPLFTSGGSFWTNNSPALLDIPPDEEPRLHPRNRCIHFGYASVALVPIRSKGLIVGLIQLNDRRKDRFTLETVEIMEGITAHIGEALIRRHAEDERNKALLRAEAAAAAKSEFLGIMSHELRTPLNGVLGFSELLADTPLDEEQKSYAKAISNSGSHLLAIVNDILDFSSIEKGAMAIHSEPLVVAELVKSSEQAVLKFAMEKGISLQSAIEPSAPEQILGDDQRIRQILINLLGNAVKFTSSGSVTLRIATATEGGGQFLDFTVEDTGTGISPETIKILFKPFTQADMKMNRTFGGTGLGLAISQRLAEAMGGKITVVSTVGKGSTFTFRLPIKKSASPRSLRTRGTQSIAQEGVLPDTGEKRSNTPVLVVEDDKTNSMLTGKMLQSLGYQVEFATDGVEALDAFAPEKYSAILMDIHMPVMNGIEATAKIRERESGTRVPIIALTAKVMPGDRELCLAAGMDDYLSKPFKMPELAAILARVTAWAHPHRSSKPSGHFFSVGNRAAS